MPSSRLESSRVRSISGHPALSHDTPPVLAPNTALQCNKCDSLLQEEEEEEGAAAAAGC